MHTKAQALMILLIKPLPSLIQMFNKKNIISFLTCALLLSAPFFVQAQKKLAFFKGALKENRDKFYNTIKTSIDRTLLLPLDSTTEESWSITFYNLALIQYKNPTVNTAIDAVAQKINSCSNDCKKAFLNLINSEYPKKYAPQVKTIFLTATDDYKLMAMAANYVLPTATAADVKSMQLQTETEFKKDPDNAILFELSNQLKSWNTITTTPSIKTFFDKNYLPAQILVFSFQRKDRNFAGLAMVRNTDGSFVKNAEGKYFAVGQLARSSSNMPGYISNGNTPQGIFRITGFDTSNNYFIGPTTNIQLAMPHEYDGINIDGKKIDTTWSLQDYKNLLPHNFKNYQPIYGTFYAGKAGRTEIIAHGTTVDIDYYKKKTYFPYTPTAGCLCTKEIWNNKTGMLDNSDQQLLATTIQNTGTTKGYLIVIEIDNKKTTVTLADVLSYLK
jgi:hypothetical protein